MVITCDDEGSGSRFIIECIEKSDPPKDMSGDYWYRYIVRQDKRKITGFMAGTLESVTEHVEFFTEGLNERSASVLSPNAHSTRGKNKGS